MPDERDSRQATLVGLAAAAGVFLVLIGGFWAVMAVFGPSEGTTEVAEVREGTGQEATAPSPEPSPSAPPPDRSPEPSPDPPRPENPQPAAATGAAPSGGQMPPPSSLIDGQVQALDPESLKPTAGELAAAEGPPAEEPSSSSPPVSPSSSGPAARKKAPLPSADDQQKVAGQLDEIYDFSKSRTDAEELRLAKELFGLGKEAEADSAEKFVLLRKAMEMAGAGGDAAMMLQVIGAMGDGFDMDTLLVKGKMLKSFADGATSSAKIESLLKASQQYVDEAGAARRYEFASNIATVAYRASQRSQGKRFRKAALQLRQRAQKMHDDHQKLDAAMLAIQADPDDREAHLALGLLHCFSRGDWRQGLPHLAKGSDAGLSAVAARELASPSEPSAQAKLGDAWWDLAAARKKEEGKALMRHAGDWYRKAQPGLAGLDKTKVEKRLDNLAEILAPASETPGITARLPLALRKALVLNWSFDKNEGAKIIDASGKGNHGKVAGAKWVASARGPRNGAFLFDGVDDLILLPPATLGNGNMLTCSVWAKVPRYDGKSWPVFIGSYIGSASHNTSIGLAQNSGTLRIEVTTDKGNFANHRGSLPVPWDQWFHAALVYDGATLTEYLNGVRGKSIRASGNLKTPNMLTLGRDHAQWDALQGMVDEVMIFNRALTEQEVRQLYKTQGGK